MNGFTHFWKNFLLIIGFLFLFNGSFAQETKFNYVGVLLAWELQYQEVRPNLGFFYERQLSPKGGLELGIFFRTDVTSLFVSIQQPDFNIAETVDIREGYINIPILYRFSTRFAAFSLGPTVDIFSNWNQIDENLIKVEDYTRNPNVEIGALLKIGKEIPLKGSALLEPELRMGFRSFVFPEGYIGIGVKLKEMFNSKK